MCPPKLRRIRIVIVMNEPRRKFIDAMSSITVPITIIPAENKDAPVQQFRSVGTTPGSSIGATCRRRSSCLKR
jgi:hypothetical protein